jgi:hypothetical protein
MALFTKLRQRVAGGNVSFDNLENIANREDERAAAGSDIPYKSRNNSGLSVFSKETHSMHSNAFASSMDSHKVVSVVPEGNSENLPPSNTANKEPTYKTLEKKASFNAGSNLGLSTAPLSARSAQDNRFATSRTNSFSRPAAPAAVPSEAANISMQKSTSTVPRSDGYSGATAHQSVAPVTREAVEEMFATSVDESFEVADEEIEAVFSKARHNRAEAVVAAVHQGFDVNSVDSYGNTILHVCAQNNHRKLASILVQRFPSINLNAENLKGLTPLDYADKYGFHKVASWLVSAGAVNGAQAAHAASRMR